MKLTLKEEPKEWLRFALVMALTIGFAAFLMHRRGVFGRGMLLGILGALAVALLFGALRPRGLRWFYRRGMTATWHLGQLLGRFWLTVFFLLVLTPMGLFLRCLGKDLLRLKRPRDASSYWLAAKPPGPFDRQF
jgi:hypothetical protein